MSKLVAYITVKDPRAAIAFYEKALPDAHCELILDGPGGSVMHGQMSVNGERLMVSGEWADAAKAHEGISPVNFVLYVEDADAAWRHAVDAGMAPVFEPADQFWGERNGSARDPDGFRWTFSHKIENVAPEEMKKRAAAFAAEMAKG